MKFAEVQDLVSQALGRPPHGGRGLKYFFSYNAVHVQSRRPPHGGRGLKYERRYGRGLLFCRPPHGGRGLKY